MSNIARKKVIVTICSKNPSYYNLSTNIQFFQKFLENYDHLISIVDSDSDTLTEYRKVENSYPDVKIHYVRNQNYEYGAYKYSYETYPDYDIYICTQDTVLFSDDVDLDIVTNDHSLIFKHDSGFLLDRNTIPFSMEVLEKSPFEYENYIMGDRQTFVTYAEIYRSLVKDGLEYQKFRNDNIYIFDIVVHNTFIVTKNVMKDIFFTLTIPPTCKLHSRAYERLFGLYFIHRNIKTTDLSKFNVIKYSGGRN